MKNCDIDSSACLTPLLRYFNTDADLLRQIKEEPTTPKVEHGKKFNPAGPVIVYLRLFAPDVTVSEEHPNSHCMTKNTLIEPLLCSLQVINKTTK